MNHLLDPSHCPSLEEVSAFIRNPIFMQICSELKDKYQCQEKIAFSSCSLEPGWNVKLKKAGKTLCTIYPRSLFCTVMVVAGRKEKAAVEAVLPECTPELQDIYRQTREWNGQKWLMVDLKDDNGVYQDLLRLIHIRRNC